VIRLRAHLLFVQLPYSAEHLTNEIQALASVLPQGSRRVISLDLFVGFLMPHTQIAQVHAARWRKIMKAFSKHWIIGLKGDLACSDSADPLRTWMDEFRDTGTVEGGQAKDVPFPQRRKPGIEDSVSDLIERTFRKVGVEPPGKGEGPEKPD
jgi:hypothetical protein